MFKIFLRLLALISFIVLVLLGIGYLLPRSYQIESSIEIVAEPDEVFAMINSLKNWQLWSNFSEERIEGLKIQYGETTEGEGAIQTWTDIRGSGKMWVTESVSPDKFCYSLNFGEFPTMESEITTSKSGKATAVVWKSTGRLPSGPFYGYSALLFPRQMTHEYDQSLLRLKDLVE